MLLIDFKAFTALAGIVCDVMHDQLVGSDGNRRLPPELAELAARLGPAAACDAVTAAVLNIVLKQLEGDPSRLAKLEAAYGERDATHPPTPTTIH